MKNILVLSFLMLTSATIVAMDEADEKSQNEAEMIVPGFGPIERLGHLLTIAHNELVPGGLSRIETIVTLNPQTREVSTGASRKFTDSGCFLEEEPTQKVIAESVKKMLIHLGHRADDFSLAKTCN